MNSESSDPSPVSPAKKSPVIKIVGIGSAGAGVLEQLARGGLPGVSLGLIHADPSALSIFPEVQKFQPDPKPGLRSSSPDPKPTEPTAVPGLLDHLRSFYAGSDVLIIIAGMGGALGNALTDRAAALAREAGIFCLVFAVLPFECEGNRRSELASAGLAQVGQSADLVICWPNQKFLGSINEGTSLLDTYTVPNRFLATCARQVCRAFTSEMAVGLRYLDLCHSIINCSGENFIAVAEAAGSNRAAEALDQIFAHPMVASSNFLASARNAAVCIMGGPSLGMSEVNRIIDQLQRQCPSTSLLMGASINEELGQTLLLTVLFSPAELPEDSCDSPGQGASCEVPSRDRTGNEPIQLLDNGGDKKRSSRFLPPPPALPQEKMEQLLKQQSRSTGRARKVQANFRQTQLPLEILSKGRFDKSEPTIHKGEDLDVPTYIRRGVSLN
jgi:cell division protein FtsZ